ncbi:MAG: hypothetical protein ACJ79S_13055 [Gemmatimonadaceae bacterium]
MTKLLRSTRLRAAFLASAAALLAACSDAPTAPSARPTAVNASVADPSAVAAPTSGTLLACPSATTQSATAVIGPRGGVVGVAGSALIVPAHAVRKPTTFTFVVPASPVVQVEIHTAGATHYEFARPVAVSISYARCAADVLPDAQLGAWWVDGATLARLGVMAGIDDRQHRRVTFITDHLSGYAVVY